MKSLLPPARNPSRNGARLRAWIFCTFLALTFPALTSRGDAPAGRILKVLPHLVDGEGRIALAPSLYQRDAYQARLRQHPDLVATVRYDVNCRVTGRKPSPLKLRLSLRTERRADADPLILEAAVKPGLFGRSWQTLTLDTSAYQQAGKVLAWQLELLEGEQVIGAQKSFLW